MNDTRLRNFVATALAFTGVFCTSRAQAQIKTAAELVNAINNGQPNAAVSIGPGTFEISAPLRPKAGMKIKGAGAGVTIIKNVATWAPGNAGLNNDEGATRSGIQCDSYLFSFPENTKDVSLSQMTLTGPQMHGAVCGVTPTNLELVHLEFKHFLWSGVRIFIVEGARIHDNLFVDSGNKSGITTGSSGGGLFLTYFSDAQIYNNRFKRSAGNDYYAIKGREARNVRIYNNSIETDFAIELPFENDHFVEIDHNYLGGTISIPKHSGGTFPAGGHSFHVHHNYFKTSYSFEYQRGGIEIDHNLFDFALNADGGNLISSFDSVAAIGPTKMHDNLIRNPGRGLYWNEGVYNNFSFTNNHIKGDTTVTPRTEGLFDFRPERDGAKTDWSTIVIRDNIFELSGTSRPLMRNAASFAAVIENNTLTNIKDSASYPNKDTGKPRGPLEKLSFKLGADEEWTIAEWTLSKSSNAPVPGTGGSSGSGGGMGMGGKGGSAGSSGSAGTGGTANTNMGGNAGGNMSVTGGRGGSDNGQGGSAGEKGSPSDGDSSSSSCSVSRLGSHGARGSVWFAFVLGMIGFCRHVRRRR